MTTAWWRDVGLIFETLPCCETFCPCLGRSGSPLSHGGEMFLHIASRSPLVPEAHRALLAIETWPRRAPQVGFSLVMLRPRLEEARRLSTGLALHSVSRPRSLLWQDKTNLPSHAVRSTDVSGEKQSTAINPPKSEAGAILGTPVICHILQLPGEKVKEERLGQGT